MGEHDDGFDEGILHQCLQDAHERRIDAFRAIRRAVAIARDHDMYAHFERIKGHDNIAAMEMHAALAIRRAIRAAIGSPSDTSTGEHK